jgi:hypothetical protein
MGFPVIAARLRDLANRPHPPTDEEARRAINDLVAQAVRHYRELAYADRKGFDRGDVPAQLTGNDHKDAPALHRCWRERIVPKLQAGFPGRVPHDPFVSNPEPPPAWVDPATATSAPQILGPLGQQPHILWPMSLWRQRAANYAAILDILAELAGEAQGGTTPTAGAASKAAATTAAARKADSVERLCRAMVLVRDNPDWPNAQIAEKIGRHPSFLSNSNEFKIAAKMARGERADRPRGYIKKDPITRDTVLEAVARPAAPGDRSDRGQPIPGSNRHFREYCDKCGDPMGVTRDKVGKKPLCDDCAE